MEQVHGVDVSWMTQASPKDKINKKPPSPPAKTPAPAQNEQTAKNPPTSAENKAPNANGTAQTNGHTPATNGASVPITRRRSRTNSVDNKSPGPNGTPPGRRNSWFSNISAKFSSSHENHAAQPPQEAAMDPPIEEHDEDFGLSSSPVINHPVIPRTTNRSAVLPPAAKSTGNGPYTPAPPRNGQAGFLGVFRRLSSSSNSANGQGRLGNGLVERKTLNVDRNRQRCPISELKAAKLRKVAFCVDVEIAPMPKYADSDASDRAPPESGLKKKLVEKGEGEALKNPKDMVETKETEGVPTPVTIAEPAANQDENSATAVLPPETVEIKDDDAPTEATTRKKEKKKKSEAERKARKEKKRKLAEANGSIPMEIRYDSSDSSEDTPEANGTPQPQTLPTTNPVRVYRRCCQLRETPILKKITEQLLDSANFTPDGIVNKLDLTGYWLNFSDVVTLGDYLAVVPIREVILENSNLNDEGLRMILAGLLAARRPGSKRRKPKHELQEQGGFVERLVIKNNQLGPDGWKHLSLFLYLCRSVKYLDVSHIAFPRQAACQANVPLPNGRQVPLGIAEIFSKALSERLGGATLELLNIGETEPTMDQLGTIMDGVIKSGVSRLGLAHNHLDEHGIGHLGRYMTTGRCEGLDLGGNDLDALMDEFVKFVGEAESLWALSLSGCNLKPSSLCKILPALVKLSNLRFVDLSYNQELFNTTPSAVGLLRRYLPKIEPLKRIHLQNAGITSEQAIAIVEVLPELSNLAHINLLENSDLVKLADAANEEEQEEACALYASLMAAARLSKSLICVDIEVPNDRSSEIVKAMAKQVVAYCLRNMERIPDSAVGAAVVSALSSETQAADGSKPSSYNDVLAHLVGHDVLAQDDSDDGQDPAPGEDYVIGGTGVVKALACCLKNRGDESRRQSYDMAQQFEDGNVSVTPKLATGGKAKDMSKHLLAGARKIRHRIQPALLRARENADDEQNLRKLIFLDDTLKGIIRRFEDEFPDTREGASGYASPIPPTQKNQTEELSGSPPREEVAVSDGEDDSKIHPSKPLSRSNSILSRSLAEEEGRILRAGHRFRSGFFTQENIDLFASIDDIGSDPKHVKMLTEMAEDIGGEFLQMVQEKGAVRTFKEDREMVLRNMKEADPDHWDNFVEAQKKARANIDAPRDKEEQGESAIAD